MAIEVREDGLMKKTLSEQVYDILYKAILSGELKPEEELVEHQIAKTLQVSRTPIREAFSRLKAQGLVQGNSYTKVVVRSMSAEDIEEVFDLRSMLELYAIDYTIDNCQEQDIAALEQILEKSRQEIAAGNLPKVAEYNTAYHETLNRLSGKKRVIHLLGSLRDIFIYHRMFGIRSAAFAEEVYQSHMKLLQLIKAKDKAAAREELSRHLLKSRRAVPPTVPG